MLDAASLWDTELLMGACQAAEDALPVQCEPLPPRRAALCSERASDPRPACGNRNWHRPTDAPTSRRRAPGRTPVAYMYSIVLLESCIVYIIEFAGSRTL